jgi:hypothetical protein
MAISDSSPNVDNYFVGKGTCSIMLAGETTWRDVGNVPTWDLTPNLDVLDHFSSREGNKKKDRSIVRQTSVELKMVMEELTTKNMRMVLMGTPSSAAVSLSTTGDIASNTTLENLASIANLVIGRRYNISGAGIVAGTTFVFNGSSDGNVLDTAATATTATLAVAITGAVSLDIYSLSEIVGRVRLVGTNDIGAKGTFEMNNVSFKPSSSISPISDEWGQFEVIGEVLVDTYGKFGQWYYAPVAPAVV